MCFFLFFFLHFITRLEGGAYSQSGLVYCLCMLSTLLFYTQSTSMIISVHCCIRSTGVSAHWGLPRDLALLQWTFRKLQSKSHENHKISLQFCKVLGKCLLEMVLFVCDCLIVMAKFMYGIHFAWKWLLLVYLSNQQLPAAMMSRCESPATLVQVSVWTTPQ